MKIHPTGFDDYIEEDRPVVYATLVATTGAGNTDQLEVHLGWSDPEDETGMRGWFRVSDLQAIVNYAIEESGKARP